MWYCYFYDSSLGWYHFFNLGNIIDPKRAVSRQDQEKNEKIFDGKTNTLLKVKHALDVVHDLEEAKSSHSIESAPKSKQALDVVHDLETRSTGNASAPKVKHALDVVYELETRSTGNAFAPKVKHALDVVHDIEAKSSQISESAPPKVKQTLDVVYTDTKVNDSIDNEELEVGEFSESIPKIKYALDVVHEFEKCKSTKSQWNPTISKIKSAIDVVNQLGNSNKNSTCSIEKLDSSSSKSKNASKITHDITKKSLEGNDLKNEHSDSSFPNSSIPSKNTTPKLESNQVRFLNLYKQHFDDIPIFKTEFIKDVLFNKPGYQCSLNTKFNCFETNGTFNTEFEAIESVSKFGVSFMKSFNDARDKSEISEEGKQIYAKMTFAVILNRHFLKTYH